MARPTKLGKPAANREADILEASLKLFAEKGSKSATMRDIARASGLTEGTLYHYFSGKDEILSRILERYTFGGRAVASAFADTPGSLREKLRAVATDFFDVLARNPHATAFILSESVRYPPISSSKSLAETFLALIRDRVAVLSHLLTEEVQAGSAKPCDTARIAAHFLNALVGYWMGEVFLAGRMPGPKARAAQTEDLVDLVMARLQPGTARTNTKP
ncbi:MAG: TetR/AcrR family transcriptional regulator [Parvibaculum sp.]|nr:TetR/AcrR family transcriptional regulator [Parvibaculum sp.]